MNKQSIELNFEDLEKNAPRHNGSAGYLPKDQYYSEICGWLAKCALISKVTANNFVVIKKATLKSNQIVIASIDASTGMISYKIKNIAIA